MLEPPGIPHLQSAFEGGDFYVPPREALDREAGRAGRGHFKIIHRDTALRADIYLVGNDPLHAWALERRRMLELESTQIWVAPLEYVILRKRQYYEASESDRHLRDISMMLRISGDTLDGPALDEWLSRLALAGAYLQARRYSSS